ncbi:MAG: L-glyceraldehyde 3-phosphate reductase [Cyclobacteriaceae bacterium]|nr:L-glyceraldehyde 3-phosphate reductase [Cyclobacteriaceae bacterium]
MRISDKTNPIEYRAVQDRYDEMLYRRCGKSGILLPAISLGLWHNFGYLDNIETARNILRAAFDAGITHFDLANNYGPPYGSAEESFGLLLKRDFMKYRDELIITTKAGYDMWPGPYGNLGSRKYLVASCDQSLKRMGLDYVDIFYHHRPDLDTPLEETMGALDHLVRQGKALYAGISNYPADLAERAICILRDMGTPCLIHQAKYHMFDRWVETDLLGILDDNGVGCIAFSPLAQGMLTDRYLDGIPQDSRAAKPMTYLEKNQVEALIPKIRQLNDIASERGQKLSQMALSWLLKDDRVTSVLIGASSVAQLKDNLDALDKIEFDEDEIRKIDVALR